MIAKCRRCQEQPAGGATDLWSLGCVYCECLTGRRAFDGDSVPDILAAVLHHEPNWDVLPRRTPCALQEVMQLCLLREWVGFFAGAELLKTRVSGGSPTIIAKLETEATFTSGTAWAVDDRIVSTPGNTGLLEIPAGGLDRGHDQLPNPSTTRKETFDSF